MKAMLLHAKDMIFRPSTRKRVIFFLSLDILAVALSLHLAFLVYFEFNRNIQYFALTRDVLPYFLFVKLFSFSVARVYRITWRYFGIIDLFNMIAALTVSGAALLGLSLLSLPRDFHVLSRLVAPMNGFPISIIFMDFTICLVLLSFLRISKRFYLEAIREKGLARRGKRTIILGAGNTGDMIVRDMARQGFAQLYPVGFLDDDSTKAGAYIHGVPVLGTLAKLEDSIRKHAIEAMIIAMPSLHRKTLSELYNSAKRLKVDTIKIVPRIYDFNKPETKLKNLEDISLEDLLGRQSISVDYRAISGFLRDRVVLITGAGGSIGSEITLQVCGFEPSRLVLFDIDETELHNLGLRLMRHFPECVCKTDYVTGDIRDQVRVNEVFDEYKPQIVFHAAAYKHVPMMEHNSGEAVKVNVFGTYMVAEAATTNHVEKFIMISSDKAVRPTSVMGATKRIAEYVCMGFDYSQGEKCHASTEQHTGNNKVHGSDERADLPPYSADASTEFISVRFGNVLGSRGSLLPLFLDQLKYGGPLTVTHKDVKRYFLTIPEAVSLVLQASVIGNGGEVLALDMGEPVQIIDVAEELIKMHGLEPYRDIGIQITGLRPGEKLFEEILTAEEGTYASKHEKIYVVRNGHTYSIEDIRKILKEFTVILQNPSMKNNERIKAVLRKYVKYYEGNQVVER